jgi:sarcosine oxidase
MGLSFDLAVIGLGAVGGSALLSAARAGVRAVGFDRFSPPHEMGSTHGETRIVRAAIGEGTAYSPFALRSFELIEQLAAETGETLLNRCGLLLLGGGLPHSSHAPHGFVETTLEAARLHAIAHDILPDHEVRKRFPAYGRFEGPDAYYEPGAGMGYPERVVAAQISRARDLGAAVHLQTPVTEIAADGSGICVHTPAGTLRATRAIVSTGAWAPRFLPHALSRHLTVTRQTLHWFEVPTDTSIFEPARMPVFIWNDLYGFPIATPGGGVKMATENMTSRFDPDAVRRPVDADDIADILPRVRTSFPQLGGHLRGATCLYTATPDSNFWIAPHPDLPGVTVVSACSGHGFKHAAAVGEAVAGDALGFAATSIPGAWRAMKGVPTN